MKLLPKTLREKLVEQFGETVDMEKAYFLLFNSLSEIMVQLKMIEASLILIQQKAEELYIGEGD